MKQLVLVVIMGAALFYAYDAYHEAQQQQLQAQSANQRYQQDKAAFEQARESGKLAPLEQFIRQRPQSAWLQSAVYYRDKLVLKKAVESRDVRRLQRFIKDYSNSEWIDNARQQLVKLNRELENARIQQRIQARTREQKSQSLSVNQTPTSITASTSDKQQKPASSNSSDRVQRALSIYQKINKQKQREEEINQQKRQREQKLVSECNRIRDQLKQFKGRTRWYRLDDQGNRKFIDKESVKQTKRRLEEDYNRHCQS